MLVSELGCRTLVSCSGFGLDDFVDIGRVHDPPVHKGEGLEVPLGPQGIAFPHCVMRRISLVIPYDNDLFFRLAKLDGRLKADIEVSEVLAKRVGHVERVVLANQFTVGFVSHLEAEPPFPPNLHLVPAESWGERIANELSPDELTDQPMGLLQTLQFQLISGLLCCNLVGLGLLFGNKSRGFGRSSFCNFLESTLIDQGPTHCDRLALAREAVGRDHSGGPADGQLALFRLEPRRNTLGLPLEATSPRIRPSFQI